jgi:hypothetical protein
MRKKGKVIKVGKNQWKILSRLYVSPNDTISDKIEGKIVLIISD